MRWAHTRRRFFDALAMAPEAQQVLAQSRPHPGALPRRERREDRGVLAGTEEHPRRRQQISADVVSKIELWLARALPKHPPKSPLGEAIRYCARSVDIADSISRNAPLPLDNNASERALRALALWRKNYLFFGSDAAGENIAGLQSLLGTCDANGVNPEAYHADVLMRVTTHPNSRIDELLPHRWRAATGVDSS